jgi:hypothetical protein
MMVIALALRHRLAMGAGALGEVSNSNTPMGPFHTTVAAFDDLVGEYHLGLGADVHCPRTRRGISWLCTVMRMASLLKLSPAMLSTRQKELHVLILRLLQDVLGDDRPLSASSSSCRCGRQRLLEGVAHATADDERIHLFQQVG